MSDAERIPVDLADRLEKLVQAKASETWDALEDLWRTEVREALDDVAQLMLLQLSDPTNTFVHSELLHAEARAANWAFVGADLVRDAVKQAIKEVLEGLGAALKGFIR